MRRLRATLDQFHPGVEPWAFPRPAPTGNHPAPTDDSARAARSEEFPLGILPPFDIIIRPVELFQKGFSPCHGGPILRMPSGGAMP